jgi:hypothetical protein
MAELSRQQDCLSVQFDNVSVGVRDVGMVLDYSAGFVGLLANQPAASAYSFGDSGSNILVGDEVETEVVHSSGTDRDPGNLRQRDYVIDARRAERDLPPRRISSHRALVLHQHFEAEQLAVETFRTFQVAHVEIDMSQSSGANHLRILTSRLSTVV